MSDDLKLLPPLAKALGYGGLIPFVALSAAAVMGVNLTAVGISDNIQTLLNYAAVIVSFIGAVHWGVALADHESGTVHYLYSVVPALLAWIFLAAPDRVALVGMAAVVVTAYFVDRAILFSRIGSGYQTLRLHLSVVVALSLLIAAAGG